MAGLKFDVGGPKMASALCAILAKAYEMLESFEKSTMWYKAAMVQDPMNCEAFSLLMHAGRLSEAEEVGFVDEVVSRLPDGAAWIEESVHIDVVGAGRGVGRQNEGGARFLWG